MSVTAENQVIELLTLKCMKCGFEYETARLRRGGKRKYCNDCALYLKSHREERVGYTRRGEIDRDKPNEVLALRVTEYRLAFEMISFLALRGMPADMREIREICLKMEAPSRTKLAS